MIGQEQLVIVILFIFLVTISILKIEYKTKLLFYTFILLEFLTTLLFFKWKLSSITSLSGIFLSTLFIINLVRNSGAEASFGNYHSHLFDNNKTNRFLFRIFGSFLIINTLVLEFFWFDSNISSYSGLSLATGIIWIFYYSIPSDNNTFAKEFLLCFFTITLIIFVFPVFFHKLIFSTMGESRAVYLDGILVGMFLSRPLTNLLQILGYNVWFEGETIYYPDYVNGYTSSLIITTGCSGLFSVGIFVAALTSFLIIEYRKVDYNIVIFYISGITVAYLANLLRMATIVLVGSYYGPERMLWTHANVGWIIFTTWMCLFWVILNKFLDTKSSIKPGSGV